MTKAERAAFARGINPLTGLPLGPAVAAASPTPAWVTEAKVSEQAAQAAQVTLTDRAWTFLATGTSNSGRDTAIFQAGMRKGGTFQATLPGDLVRALRSGKVLNMK